MNKKFFIAWAVIFVAWMIGSFIVHGALLSADYAQLPNLSVQRRMPSTIFRS